VDATKEAEEWLMGFLLFKKDGIGGGRRKGVVLRESPGSFVSPMVRINCNYLAYNEIFIILCWP
jgi:hypothetical protein